MAEDKNKNEDPEEEKKDIFDDDEDFGLPDLDYDELDDEDSDDEEEEDEAVAESEEEVENLDDVEFSDEDLEVSEEQDDWEKELEKELESELESEDGDSNVFYEEESYDEFEASAEEGETESTEAIFEDGEDDIAAFDDSAFQEAEEPVRNSSSEQKETYAGGASFAGGAAQSENKAKFVRTVVIGTLLIVAIAFTLIFFYDGSGDSEKEVAKVEEPVVVKEPKEVKPEPKPEPVKPKPAPKPKAQQLPSGEITKLEQPTGQTYIIVGSFFDDDLATDFAESLAKKGNSPIVIPPFRDSRFYRVAIAGFGTFKDGQASLNDFKGEFGDDIWPLRY